jgi:hypothetical protein
LHVLMSTIGWNAKLKLKSATVVLFSQP